MNVEKHKYRCGIRQLLSWRNDWGLREFRQYIHKPEFDWQTLRDVEEQWIKGNRGKVKGEWK